MQLTEKAEAAGIPLVADSRGGMFGLFFTEADSVSSFDQVMECDQERFKKFFHGMLEQGVYMAPSAFEAGFISCMHTDEEIQKTVAAAEVVFQNI